MIKNLYIPLMNDTLREESKAKAEYIKNRVIYYGEGER